MQQMFKKIVTAVAVGFAVYWLIFPLFWPPPTVTASVPGTMSLGETPEITLVVRAWHSNVHVAQIRFYVDSNASTARGPKGLINPTVLLDEAPKASPRFLRRDLFTRPWSKRLTVEVPVRDWAQQQRLGRGLLVGKLDVTLNYPSVSRRTPATRFEGTRSITRSIPFRITVTP